MLRPLMLAPDQSPLPMEISTLVPSANGVGSNTPHPDNIKGDLGDIQCQLLLLGR